MVRAAFERRSVVGGACVTEEVFPGYRVSTAAYLVSLLQEKVVRDLELRRFGYEVLPKDPAYFAPYLDGRYLFMYADQRRTCQELARFSTKDAERYPAYEQFIERLARFVEPMLLEAPPNVPPRRPADVASLSRLGLRLLRQKRLHTAGYHVRQFPDGIAHLVHRRLALLLSLEQACRLLRQGEGAIHAYRSLPGAHQLNTSPHVTFAMRWHFNQFGTGEHDAQHRRPYLLVHRNHVFLLYRHRSFPQAIT